MLLWILFAVMTAAVMAAVLAPLARPNVRGDRRRSGSIAVYRDQLEELEADRARGLIDAGEAAAQHCALRWIREGRRVRIARPPRGLDFNDVLLGRTSCDEEDAA